LDKVQLFNSYSGMCILLLPGLLTECVQTGFGQTDTDEKTSKRRDIAMVIVDKFILS